MRRKDKELQADEALRLLQSCEYGVLSTVDGKGQPYGVPLSYVLANGVLYFHCALEGHKLDNLAANQKVSFCVVGSTHLFPANFSTVFESALAFGEAVVVQGEERSHALVSLLEKYSAEFMEEGRAYIEQFDSRTKVVKIEISTVTGKAAPAKRA